MVGQTVENKNANALSNAVAEVLYKDQISALKETLDRFHVSERHYTILDVRDDSVCMLCDGGQWNVFSSERGMETNKKSSLEIQEACEMLLYSMSETDEEYKQMVQYFSNIQKKSSLKSIPYSEVYKALKAGLKKIGSTAATF